jgi:hypothetical protein
VFQSKLPVVFRPHRDEALSSWLARTRRTTPWVVSSTASRTSCSDDGSELLTKSIRWLTSSRYRTCQGSPLQPAPKAGKIRFRCSVTLAAKSDSPGGYSHGQDPSSYCVKPQSSGDKTLVSGEQPHDSRTTRRDLISTCWVATRRPES